MDKWYAFVGGIQHYWKIVQECLRLEREGPSPLKRLRREIEFLPAVEEVTDAPPSPLGRAILLAIAGFFTLAVTWASIGEVDIIATAQGRVIPSGNTKIIQPFETGIVRAIHVRDGQMVKQGDVLVELNPTDAAADATRLARELITAQVTAARLEALLYDDPLDAFFPPEGAPDDLVDRNRRHLESAYLERVARVETIDNEITQRRAEISTTKAEISGLDKILPKVRDRVNSSGSLLEKGFTPRIDHLKLEEELIALEQRRSTAISRLDELMAVLRATTSRSDQLIAEERRTTQDQLAEVTARADSLAQELIKASDRNRQQTLRAPVDGVVQQLAIHTQGGVVTPAQELMVIVPAADGIVIEAMIQNKDIGFVVEGQDAEIKVDSFPFTKYGTIRGDVKTVSRDAVLDENQGWVYPARFNLWETEIIVGNKPVSLSPGMTVMAEIKTGKRKLIQYLLAPLQEYQSESLREQ
jgi:HlyD family type I secretion membrane fusion protein